MRCLHCGKRISILRKLADGEFCSAEHRQLFQQQQNDLALARLIESQRRIERPGAAAVKAEPPAVKAQPAKETRKQAKPAEEAVPWAAFQPLPQSALVWRRVLVPSAVSLWAAGARCLPHGEFTTLIGGMSRPGKTPVFEGRVGRVAAPRERTWTGVAECWSTPAPFFPRLAGQAIWSAPAAESESAVPEETAPPLASLVGIRMAAAPLRAPAEAQAMPNPVPVSARLSRSASPAARWIPAGGVFDDDGAPPWAPSVPHPPLPPVNAPACVCELAAGAELPRVDRSAELPDGWLANQAALPAVLSGGSAAALPPPAAVMLGRAAIQPSAQAMVARGDEGAAHPRHAVSAADAGPVPADGLLAPPVPCPQPGCAHVCAVPLPAARPSSWSTALPPAALEADQTAYWNVIDRLTASEQAGHIEEVGASLTAAEVAADEPYPEVEAEGAPASVALEPEPDPAPLQTRLCPILVWQIADCPRGDFRTPDLRGSARWAEHLRKNPFMPRFRSMLDGADRAALSRPERQPRANSKPLASLRSRLDLLTAGRFWAQAPADLRWIAVGMPLILALVLYSFRSTQPKSGEAGVKLATAPTSSILGSQFASVQNVIMERAAVHLVDDFRSGLSSWEGQPGWSKTWKYSDATFLEPGQLAFFAPTMKMSDYTFEFLGQIERQGLSWVVRAKDHRNFVALRIVLTRPGPLPAASMVRYTVINGREGPVTTLPIPFPVKSSTMYRIRMEVRGEDFTTYIQGQVVDHFTEKRLESGGVGFYSSRNERSLLRWVEVTHQYDYLGRLCALFAPYDVQAGADKAD